MVVTSVRARVKRHPVATTAVLTVVGYVAVVGAFVSPVVQGLFPDLSLAQVNLLADAIAVVNSVATALLAAGWYWIRQGDVRKHRRAMSSAFLLILVFLALYLPKVAGGGTKHFVGPDLATYAYLLMLAVHILLSILAVPVVLYAIVLGLTHTPREIRTGTPHRRVGRVAAASWILSLTLGVLTYVLLNHVYDWEFVEAALLPVGLL